MRFATTLLHTLIEDEEIHTIDFQNLYPTLLFSSVLYHAITNGKIDWHQFAQGYMQATRAGIDRVLADPLVDDPRIVHLRFKDLTQDPIGVLQSVYARFGLPFTAEADQHMHRWLDDPAHRPDRYGRYPYSLEPFGLKAADIARTFADYSERFGLH